MLPGSSSKHKSRSFSPTTTLCGLIGFLIGVCVTALLFVVLGEKSRADVTINGGASRIAGLLMDPSHTYGGQTSSEAAEPLPIDDLGSPGGMIVLVPFSIALISFGLDP